MAGGFFSLGEMIAGGGIDREGAFLEGLDTGSKIKARQATTINALAQARGRVDEQEAREGLADALDELGLPPEMAVAARAGLPLNQITDALLGQQERGNRENLADLAVSPQQRLQSAQAIEVPKNPFQFGPGGDLVANVFEPGDAPGLSLTGPAAVDLDVARAENQRASAALSDEKRLHPDRFKATSKASSPSGLAEIIVPEDGGTAIVPKGLNPEEAFGAESFFTGGANALSDFVGLGLPFPDQAVANNFAKEMSARIQIILRGDVPGSRPPVIVQQLLARYAEEPQQLFRGDEQARINLSTTLASLQRSEQRVRKLLNAPIKRTATREQVLADNLIAFTDTIADLKEVIRLLDQGEADAPDATGERQVGTTFDLPGGGTATRIE